MNEDRGVRKDRRWADRYINASRPVQYDDEGRAHYMDEDDDDDTVEMYDPHALVEPDRYINNEHGRSARIARQKASNPSLRRAPTANTYEPMPVQSKSKSLKSRTKRFFGFRHGSGGQVPPEDLIVRHDYDRSTNFGYESDEYAPAEPPTTQTIGESQNNDYDDLDRELMGLSTCSNYPPVRSGRGNDSRRAASNGAGRSKKPVASPRASSSPMVDMSEPTRDVLEYEHTF